MDNISFTQQEIFQQAGLWKKVYRIVRDQKAVLRRILDELRGNCGSEVIFTGAGSSFFIGEMVAGHFQRNTGLSSRAVASTEIVTHPYLYINPDVTTLLVSFARSGNSPESVAAVELAEKVSDRVVHLMVTCNEDGDLIRRAKVRERHVLLMPAEANDKGLAMTSSVTSMALAAILISKIGEIESLESKVDIAASFADRVIEKHSGDIRSAAALDFRRAVFLGSGPLMGVAREAHLKLQEMTDGEVICKFDSFLGFRHGPKVVVNNETLVVYLHSNDPYVQHYERDLAVGIRREQEPKLIISISERPFDTALADVSICLSEGDSRLDEDMLGICLLIPAQLLGLYKSLHLGLDPDSPSRRGAIHRIVQGVVIHAMDNETHVTNA